MTAPVIETLIIRTVLIVSSAVEVGPALSSLDGGLDGGFSSTLATAVSNPNASVSVSFASAWTSNGAMMATFDVEIRSLTYDSRIDEESLW